MSRFCIFFFLNRFFSLTSFWIQNFDVNPLREEWLGLSNPCSLYRHRFPLQKAFLHRGSFPFFTMTHPVNDFTQLPTSRYKCLPGQPTQTQQPTTYSPSVTQEKFDTKIRKIVPPTSSSFISGGTHPLFLMVGTQNCVTEGGRYLSFFSVHKQDNYDLSRTTLLYSRSQNGDWWLIQGPWLDRPFV